MESPLSTQEQQLCQLLADLPARFGYRYNEEASRELLTSLFWSLSGGNPEYMRLLFPSGKPPESLKLSDAQGAVEGAEYTEAARGKRCVLHVSDLRHRRDVLPVQQMLRIDRSHRPHGSYPDLGGQQRLL